MAQRECKQAVNVRINRNGKTLNFSTKASTLFDGYDDVELFEKDGVVAVRGILQLGYHLSSETGRPRKALSNAQLVAYLCEKFGCELGTKLPAWIGKEEDALFFGGMQTQTSSYVLDESYTPLDVEYNRRAGDWAYVHDNWIEFTQEVREALPERLTAFRCGSVVLLSGDPAGSLMLTPRRQSGNLMLVSHALADYLRGLYDGEERGMRLHAALLPEGVALADNPELLSVVNLTQSECLTLDNSNYCFITIGTKGTLYLSAPAWEEMEGALRLDVYSGAGGLALRVDRNGGLRINECGYAHYIHNIRFSALLKERWPEAKKIYLQRRGDLWLLGASATCPATPQPASRFKRLELRRLREEQKPKLQRVAVPMEERSVYGR